MRKTLVATCGSFDGDLHKGHLNLLQEALAQGDLLYIFVVPDAVITRNKQREPIYPQEKRVANLQGTGIAKRVIPLLGSDEDQLCQIETHLIDVWCFGEDQYSAFDVSLQKLFDIKDTRLTRVPRYKPSEFSTTKLHFEAINPKNAAN